MPQQVTQKTEPVASESAKQVAQAASPAEVDYAVDLFNMLSMDGLSENGSGAASADDNSWPGFQRMYRLSFFKSVFCEPFFSALQLFFLLGYFFWVFYGGKEHMGAVGCWAGILDCNTSQNFVVHGL